ncbi:MAG: hypothetical protein M3394_09605, partial [Actinomycetota bacterium]|nr:hypothetical protein [Actinomycetota bacterium]
FGTTDVALDAGAGHGARAATYRWHSPGGSGRVYLRRVVLPLGFPVVPYAWVVVGATSDHLRVTGLRADGGRLQFELARHETTATGARVLLPTGPTEVDLAQPRSIDVALDGPATIRVDLAHHALTEWRVDPPQALPPGKPSANLRGILEVVPNLSLTEAAARYLRERFDLGEDLAVEPVGGDSLDVRYRSARIGSGTVRMGTTEQASIVVAVVGDGLMVGGMAIADEVRRITLSSFLPGRVSVRLSSGRGKAIGRGSTTLPGVDMLTGLPVTMADEPDPGTAPVAEFRVEGPRGTTVAVYCLIG